MTTGMQSTEDMHRCCLENLRELLRTGQFHHATYRNIGTLWEGHHFYRHDANGFRGFSHAGIIGKDSPYAKEAEDLLLGTGVSFGAYGQG